MTWTKGKKILKVIILKKSSNDDMGAQKCA